MKRIVPLCCILFFCTAAFFASGKSQGDEYDDEDGNLRFNAGDIVISLDSLRSNAETFNVTMNEELKRLLIHGILHLSGMDHSDNDPQQEMLQLQEKILKEYSNAVVYQE